MRKGRAWIKTTRTGQLFPIKSTVATDEIWQMIPLKNKGWILVVDGRVKYGGMAMTKPMALHIINDRVKKTQEANQNLSKYAVEVVRFVEILDQNSEHIVHTTLDPLSWMDKQGHKIRMDSIYRLPIEDIDGKPIEGTYPKGTKPLQTNLPIISDPATSNSKPRNWGCVTQYFDEKQTGSDEKDAEVKEISVFGKPKK